MLAFCQPTQSTRSHSNLTVSGTQAIKDSNSNFHIDTSRGVGIITPTSPYELSGWIHFTLPSPSGSCVLRRVDLDFEAVNAYVDEVGVYVGNARVHHIERGDRQTGSFGQRIYGMPVYNDGERVLVSVLVGFDGLDGVVTFNWVGVEK
ncbi:hypothetical protein QBC38DRAFT_458437 [Podospora fimiseda]|uniref:Uncharacterized protein n=1 Tax=Podospora fimiseda TaxID=252190 RepID=A0AAN7GX31_9PEZI|nr:hypothetical protein QBC38DRAFT_458437 [Podospora fimiseda]